jgi:histidyl-tRNA synthetase
MEFRAIKGMNDILPDEARRFALVEAAFRRVVELHGYSEVRTPVLEPTELFVRSTGETSEIVEKQMFTLTRESESFTLRPEGTPGMARAFLNASVHAKEPVTRWYYIGRDVPRRATAARPFAAVSPGWLRGVRRRRGRSSTPR